ncbi:putative acetyltransferase domain protein [Gregarina niphandrodes]|uniref:Acetyltransferase domain protein n=1 Tax=Gregarina niphandrodes TaxID=110365 RepID=A0A023B3V9_GRENI|nr:putative acetyltransferase domain protein [Gregarina niphandrodes]EZG56043.1 putative acetyltransferase domain protein [Gregarina niphandrodes]|eukprot:XP_011131362.1 putative acetyltransferase domain protein [Gregarina niphandrodes]
MVEAAPVKPDHSCDEVTVVCDTKVLTTKTESYHVSDIGVRQLSECRVPNLVLKPMTIEDYDRVRDILPSVTRCSSRYSRETVEQMLQFPSFFPFIIVDTLNDTLIGYAEVHRMPHLGRGMDGRLEKVIIKEEYRGKKVAQVACRELMDIAKNVLNCGRCDLTVEKPDAMTVYERLGFEPVSTNVWRLML